MLLLRNVRRTIFAKRTVLWPRLLRITRPTLLRLFLKPTNLPMKTRAGTARTCWTTWLDAWMTCTFRTRLLLRAEWKKGILKSVKVRLLLLLNWSNWRLWRPDWPTWLKSALLLWLMRLSIWDAAISRALPFGLLWPQVEETRTNLDSQPSSALIWSSTSPMKSTPTFLELPSTSPSLNPTSRLKLPFFLLSPWRSPRVKTGSSACWKSSKAMSRKSYSPVSWTPSPSKTDS